jgi:hypothetical protein
MSSSQLQSFSPAPASPVPASPVQAGPSASGAPSQSPVYVPVRRPSVALASSRAFASNQNHHLWRNGRLWWIAFTLIHDGWRQERIRQSLSTDNVLEARRRRDAILSLFAPVGHGCLDPEPESPAN